MAQPSFTMMGNNILQNFIRENKVDCDAAADGLPDPYGDGTGCVDHYFLTRSPVLPDRYETVIDAEAPLCTDHAPQRFTFCPIRREYKGDDYV